MKERWLLLLVLLIPWQTFAQNSTTVTINSVTDSGGVVWASGTYQFTFVGQPNSSWPGGALSNAIPTTPGALSAAGGASQSVPSNAVITPSPSVWNLTVCPNASVSAGPSGCFSKQFTIGGSTESVTITPPAISISASLPPPIVAYADAEMSGAAVGSTYYNFSTGQRVCNALPCSGANWGSSGSSSGTTIVTSNPATCAVGQTFFNTTTGLFLTCTSVNTLTVGVPPVTANLPSVINVKNPIYGGGAKGDTQTSNVGVITVGNPDVNCANCNFKASDVGKSGNITVSVGVGPGFNGNPTIASFISSTHITMSSNATNNVTANFTWGTDDTVAVLAAVTAWVAQLKNSIQQANNFLGAPSSPPPTLYFPAGNYQVCNIPSGLIVPGAASGGKIIGDGVQVSVITECGHPTIPGSGGILLNLAGNSQNFLVQGLTFYPNFAVNGTTPELNVAGSSNTFRDVLCESSDQTCLNIAGSGELFDNFQANQCFINVVCNACTSTVFINGGASNGNVNFKAINATGESNNGGLKLGHNFWDECASPPCAQLINSNDVYSEGDTWIGQTTALSVDANSYMHMVSDVVSPFGNDSNTSGITIANGGTVASSDTQFNSSGTGKCINNSGLLLDNGNNSCANQFPIASGTSTTTTAVLTATTVGANVNTNCTVGDTLIVTGATVAGYNGVFKAGVTATSATTITYTTIGSGIGAAGAGGFFYCRNLQSYTGNLPIALLNNPVPNTCYATSALANGTSVLLCNFVAQSATNITRITASSTTTTACATPPIVTISNGTGSVTLTLTTAKTQWDSAVDTSTGVGATIFKPNTTLTVKYDAGALSVCATPPTNFSLSYNISPILSN